MAKLHLLVSWGCNFFHAGCVNLASKAPYWWETQKHWHWGKQKIHSNVERQRSHALCGEKKQLFSL